LSYERIGRRRKSWRRRIITAITFDPVAMRKSLAYGSYKTKVIVSRYPDIRATLLVF
jgi:hypothetical protein